MPTLTEIEINYDHVVELVHQLEQESFLRIKAQKSRERKTEKLNTGSSQA